MGYRFWRRLKVAPGVTLNLSKGGGSLSFGPRGAKFTVKPGGGERVSLGIPGTGLFYTRSLPSSGPGKGRTVPAGGAAPSRSRLDLGFFVRLVTPPEERSLVAGLKALVGGDDGEALARFREAAHLADGACLAGFLSLKSGDDEAALRYLTAAREGAGDLGRYLDKYGIEVAFTLPITEEVTVRVGPTPEAVLLALVELFQRRGRWDDAIELLRRLLELHPEDVVAKVSLAELLLEARPGDPDTCREVVRLAEGTENRTEFHAALLLYEARALRGLGLHEAARTTLTAALRRRKDRSPELLRAIRYERALAYQALGQARRARSDWEKIYAEAPDYEDVAARLGLSPAGPRS